MFLAKFPFDMQYNCYLSKGMLSQPTIRQHDHIRLCITPGRPYELLLI